MASKRDIGHNLGVALFPPLPETASDAAVPKADSQSGYTAAEVGWTAFDKTLFPAAKKWAYLSQTCAGSSASVRVIAERLWKASCWVAYCPP